MFREQGAEAVHQPLYGWKSSAPEGPHPLLRGHPDLVPALAKPRAAPVDAYWDGGGDDDGEGEDYFGDGANAVGAWGGAGEGGNLD